MTLDCRSTSWLNEFSMAHDAASSAMGSASRRLGRGRIGRRHHRRGRLMVVGRLPRGGRRDGIFRLGTRPGRRRRRRRRRGGSRLRLVLHPGPPGALGCDGIVVPTPPAPASPGVASAAAATGRRPDGPFHRDDPTGPAGASEAPGKTRPSTPPTARATSARLRGAETRARPSCVRESRAESARSTTEEPAITSSSFGIFPRAARSKGVRHFRRSFLGSSRVRSRASATRQIGTKSRENPSGKPSRGNDAFEPRASERRRSKRADARDITMPSASIDEGVGVDANDDGRMEEGAVELGGPGDAPNHADEGASVPHPHAGQKPGSAVFNLSSAIIGAGIMAIPNAFRVLGVLGGVLALVAMHVVTGTTVRFLVRATEASGAGTYAACAARFCGDAARVAVQLAIVLNNFGIMVVYQIIFGDVLAGTPADLRTLPDVDPGPGSDAEDYADYAASDRDNATRVYPPPLPPAAPPSDEDDEDAAPAALLPWAFARAGGSCRVPVAAVAPNGS